MDGATIGVLSTAISVIFIPLSIPLGEHWLLSDDEAFSIAEKLQAALSTLPSKNYADLKKYLDRFVPWVALVMAVGQVVAPKIEETQRLREAKRDGNPFPHDVEVPSVTYAPPPVRERSDAAGDGSQIGGPDTFGTFPDAD
jgi:hypothetical protein